MYAHEVIDDIKKYTKKCLHKKTKNTYEHLENLIRGSVKFNLPEFHAVDKSGLKDKDIFDEPDLLKNCKLPFPICWFDFIYDDKDTILPDGIYRSSKRGVLVIEENGYLNMIVFPYMDDMKKWVPPISGTQLHLDKKERYFGQLGIQEIIRDDIINRNEKENVVDRAHVLQCLTMLNCKNIEMVDNIPSKKINKKRRKKKKEPRFIYKTLSLKPIGKKQESQAAQGLWENGVHLCRGHFKTYTEEKPLFGKLVGTYWWPWSVRGKAKNGAVLKDYKIETI